MIPKRAVAAIASTAIALALLLNFKTATTFTVPTSAVVGQPTPGSTSAAGASTGSGHSAASGASGSGQPAASSGATGSGSGSGGSGNAPGPSSGANGSTTSSGSNLKNGQYTGAAVQIPFGTVQVQVTISAGRITDVQALQMPSSHAYSAQISQYVTPMLKQEVLQAQSAQINLISGATYTTEAYAQSLGSALSQA